MYPEENTIVTSLVLKLLFNSKILTKFGSHTIETQENLKNLSEKYASPSTQEDLREIISTDINKIYEEQEFVSAYVIWSHFIMLNLQIFSNFLP